jgi:hypothetical protein
MSFNLFDFSFTNKVFKNSEPVFEKSTDIFSFPVSTNAFFKNIPTCGERAQEWLNRFYWLFLLLPSPLAFKSSSKVGT